MAFIKCKTTSNRNKSWNSDIWNTNAHSIGRPHTNRLHHVKWRSGAALRHPNNVNIKKRTQRGNEEACSQREFTRNKRDETERAVPIRRHVHHLTWSPIQFHIHLPGWKASGCKWNLLRLTHVTIIAVNQTKFSRPQERNMPCRIR